MTRPKTPSFLSRRAVLASGAGLAAAAAMPVAGRAPGVGKSKSRVRNVIFLVSDGMSVGTFTLAELMRQARGDGRGHWSRIWEDRRAARAVCKTFSADSFVTDSAAAGSAWGIGEHINNGAVNVTPDGRRPTPILPHARQSGKATGLVTTTHVCHATPASFVANADSRSDSEGIAPQLLDRGVDVILGGGTKYFPDAMVTKHSDITYVKTRDELMRAPQSGRLLGLFNSGHLSYHLDRQPTEPTIAEMTRVAIDRLDRSPEGFVLQVEGGRVDHAAHGNDAMGLIHDQIAFDNAVGVAMEYASARDDTLVIVTTDHGNANPGLTLYQKDSILGMQRLSNAKQSFEWIMSQVENGGNLIEAVTKATGGLTLASHELEIIERGINNGQPVDPFGPRNSPTSILGSVLANHFGVAFISPNHTADYVEYTAFGPGAEEMPGFIDNIDAHGQMVRALGLPAPRPITG